MLLKKMYILLRPRVLKIKCLILLTLLLINVSLHAKINEVKGAIISNINLATNATLATVENKKPNVNDLVE